MLLLVALCRILSFVTWCGCRNVVGFNHRVHMAFPRVTWMTSPLISFTFSVFFNENTNIPEGIKRFFFCSLRKFEWFGFSAVERYNIVYLYSRLCVREIHEILDANDQGRERKRGRAAERESVTENSVNRAKKFSKQSSVFCVCVRGFLCFSLYIFVHCAFEYRTEQKLIVYSQLYVATMHGHKSIHNLLCVLQQHWHIFPLLLRPLHLSDFASSFVWVACALSLIVFDVFILNVQPASYSCTLLHFAHTHL